MTPTVPSLTGAAASTRRDSVSPTARGDLASQTPSFSSLLSAQAIRTPAPIERSPAPAPQAKAPTPAPAPHAQDAAPEAPAPPPTTAPKPAAAASRAGAHPSPATAPAPTPTARHADAPSKDTGETTPANAKAPAEAGAPHAASARDAADRQDAVRHGRRRHATRADTSPTPSTEADAANGTRRAEAEAPAADGSATAAANPPLVIDRAPRPLPVAGDADAPTEDTVDSHAAAADPITETRRSGASPGADPGAALPAATAAAASDLAAANPAPAALGAAESTAAADEATRTLEARGPLSVDGASAEALAPDAAQPQATTTPPSPEGTTVDGPGQPEAARIASASEASSRAGAAAVAAALRQAGGTRGAERTAPVEREQRSTGSGDEPVRSTAETGSVGTGTAPSTPDGVSAAAGARNEGGGRGEREGEARRGSEPVPLNGARRESGASAESATAIVQRPAEAPPAANGITTAAPSWSGAWAAAQATTGAAPVSASASDATVTLPIPAAVDSPDFAPALAVSVSVLARDGIGAAKLQLHPAEMGPIEVRIRVEGDQARIEFGAELAATRSAIEAGLPELAHALREAGLHLAGSTVQDAPSAPPADTGRPSAGGQDLANAGGGRQQDPSARGDAGGSPGAASGRHDNRQGSAGSDAGGLRSERGAATARSTAAQRGGLDLYA